MTSATQSRDAIIIGGGFYGVAIAVYLSRQRGLRDVLLVERGSRLLGRASYNNQARVHNGYHYPRSFTTAYRSRINFPRFVRDWSDAVSQDFTKLYAIARRNSKVTARQFERFCREIGATLQPAHPSLRALFEPRLIEDVFEVQEYAFDSTRLLAWGKAELAACNVEVRLQTCATAIRNGPEGRPSVVLERNGGSAESVSSRYVFNCTYSGLNQFGGDFPRISSSLKHEITEMALMKMPSQLAGLGVTVMDGPFFSMMPFPARGMHTLSHVRYTPHMHWQDQPGVDPYRTLDDYARDSRVDRMVRDVSRYLPAVAKATYMESLFEIKTVLVKNEGDDGRPILFEKHAALPACFSVLGGKIDNIYDVLEKLDDEAF
ncbi:MAG: FAD-binding oxidoreductase [Pseudomonadota bacterium]|nr:FAD-binding oxidoreductase [Pseudomonadota bacterium]